MSTNRIMLTAARHSSHQSDPVESLLMGAESSRISNKITEYTQIDCCQNYFLCSAICSVGLKLGSGIDDYHFYANFTGDNFTYLYSDKVGNPDGTQCDSGVTNYFFSPQLVKNAYAAFGYDCIYISNSEIKKNFRAVMHAIKTSVDKDIPVLAWGMGNVTVKSGHCVNPLPEGCLIGGYDENDILYVNLYLPPDHLPKGVDEFGYSAITNGLATTYGLFFAGEKLPPTDRRQLYQNAIDAISSFLTHPPTEGNFGRYAFGKLAFDIWAETLETDSLFENKTEQQLNGVCWDCFSSPYCCICTSFAYDFIKGAAEQYPDLTMAVTLLPLYKKMQDYKDEIWAYQGGFYTPIDKLITREFRSHIADILRKMGGVCDEIVIACGEARAATL